MPWENGAWFGAITAADQRAGGAWVIGNKPHCSDPDFPGCVGDADWPSVKIWFAGPDKYGGDRYSMRNRLDSYLGEYVRVMTGRLDCLVEDCWGSTLLWRLEYPAEGIDLLPNIERRWQLPDDVAQATGITVCHRELTRRPSLGNQYEFAFWDVKAPSSLLVLDAPINLKGARYQFIAPFRGGCFLAAGICAPSRSVPAGEYVFLKASERPQWTVQPSWQARGVVIYF